MGPGLNSILPTLNWFKGPGAALPAAVAMLAWGVTVRAVDVQVNYGQILGTQPMAYGTNEVPGQLPPSQVASARLAELRTGWCRYWLSADIAPAPGVWNWTTADLGVSRILAAGARPMMCFAGIPDWMAATPVGNPGWNRPRDLQEWGGYCVAVVDHFRNLGHPVESWLWEIWNEPNNYSGSGPWTVEGYLAVYDAAAAALRAAYPAIRVGGPSTDGNPSSWIVPLLQGHDVQFITWHRYGSWDPTLSKPDSQYMAETAAFGSAAASVEHWINTYRPGEGILNICGELNLNAYCCPIDSRIWAMMCAPWYASCMRHMLLAGCDIEMFFVGTDKSWPNYGLFLGVGDQAGLRSPAFFGKRLFAIGAPRGAQRVASTSGSTALEVLATRTPVRDSLILIHKADVGVPVQVAVQGVPPAGAVLYTLDQSAYNAGQPAVSVLPGPPPYSLSFSGYAVGLLEICPPGMICDQDLDDDGVINIDDNCPRDANPAQSDLDGDGAGDACDLCPTDPLNDADGDGYCADMDNCPGIHNPDQSDGDGDGRGDPCDACPGTPPWHPVDEQGCPIRVKADFDGDRDVDQLDYAFIQRCVDIAGLPSSPGCEAAQLDGDADVDAADVLIFLRCMSAPGVLPGPTCFN